MVSREEMLRERELLENKIQDVILKFEEKTGLSVNYIEVRHEVGEEGQLSIPWIAVDACLNG